MHRHRRVQQRMPLPHWQRWGVYLIGAALLIALPIRDAYITQLRAHLEARKVFVPPTFLAKSKTAVVMGGMGVILAGLAYNISAIMAVGLGMLVIGAAMSVWTALGYMKAGRN